MDTFENWMGIGKTKLGPLVQVTLKAHFRRSSGIDDGMMRAAGLTMQAGRPMTGFAADLARVRARRLQSGVRGRLEVARNLGMALFTTLGASKSRARNLWRNHDRPGYRCARNKHHSQGQSRKDCQEKLRMSANPGCELFEPGKIICPH